MKKTPQSARKPEPETTTKQGVAPVLPQLTTTVEQNVKPVVNEAQRIAAETSVSGRRAVSRGTIFLAFYLWLLAGALMFSFIARYTQLFPGDKSITLNLQRRQNPWFRRFMLGISEIGFSKW